MTLTIKQARKVLAALDGPSVTDTDVADIYNHIKRSLEERDTNTAPWRKVTGRAKGTSLRNYYDELECGHRYRLRYSKNWMEERASKRRCQECFKAGQS